jgi:hypothetical protein
MRTRPLAIRLAAFLFLAAALAPACNSVFGNAPGYLVDTDAALAKDGDTPSPPDAVADAGGLTEAGDGSSIPDAASEADAAWTPGSFGADLALWLDGDRGVMTAPCDAGACVSMWADQSSHGNDAKPLVSYAPPLRSPTLFNGHGALHFDGSQTSLVISDNASLQFQNGLTVVAVAAMNPATHTGGIYGKSVIPPPFQGAALWVNYARTGVPASNGRVAAQIDYTQSAFTDGGYADSALRVYAMLYDGAVLEVRVNHETPFAVAASGPIDATGTPAYIGGRPSTQVWFGDIAEVIVVRRGLSEGEYARAYAYLTAKYGL